MENRQLLATIVAGTGDEVLSNVTLANGNTYDQILLTGSTITVKADAGQVTRIDFLDPDGDIIRAELAGAGELTVALSDFKEAAKPAEYATDTKYVQGLAGFRITGSDASTNFTLYSLGSVNVHDGSNNPVFAGGAKDGGNNFANAARLTIEADGLRNFGGIRAGNAVFGGASGFVGIAAGNIRFAGPIVLGGIAPTDSALGVLQISGDSPNPSITLAGTDLVGATLHNGGVKTVIATGGQSSMGVERPTVEFSPGRAFVNPAEVTAIQYVSTAKTLTLDGDTTAAQLAAYAKLYFNDVVVADDFTGTFSAKLIRNLTVEGDLDAIIRSEGAINDVVIKGGIVEGGAIEAKTGIANVTVTGSIDFSSSGYDTGVSAVISTTRGDIGSVRFAADVDLANGDVPLVSAGGRIGSILGRSLSQSLDSVRVFEATGDIGEIEFTGEIDIDGAVLVGGALGALVGGTVATGAIEVDGSIGALLSTSGDLNLGSVTAAQSILRVEAADDLILGGLVSEAGDIGDLLAGEGLQIDGRVSADAGRIGNLVARGGNLTINDVVSSAEALGKISVTGSDYDLVFGADGAFVATTAIGDVTVASGGIVSANVGTAEFAANQIGNVSVTGHQSTSVLLSDVVFVADGIGATIGDISLNASANSTGAIAASAGPATSAVAGTGFSSSGSIGDITIVGHEDGKLLVNNADVLLFRAGNSNMGASAIDETADENEIAIGNISIQADFSSLSSARGTGLIIAAGIKVTTGGEFVSGTATSVTAPAKAGEGSIGTVRLVDFGGASVTGFNRSALASTAAFNGGSVIVADSIGAIEVEAGDTIVADGTATARKGALDTNGDGEFQGNGDLYVIVI